MRRRSIIRVLGAAAAVVLFTSCEAAIELNAEKHLAPDSPTVDEGLRPLARAHSQDGCDAGAVLTTPDPDATYGPGTIELTDREPLDPALDPPKDDHKATSAIWQRFRTDPRLDDGPWARMAAGETLCDDGYLYMTLLLQSDDTDGWAPGVRRLTAGDAAARFGGITADGSTVAFQSRATNLVAGSTDPDLYLYDLAGDTLAATGAEPQEWNPSSTPVLSADGSTVVYEEEAFDDESGVYRYMRSYDVATGTITPRGASFAGFDAKSLSADGTVLAYQEFGAGGTDLWVSALAGPTRYLYPADGFTYDASVSDDGRYVSVNGNGARVYDRTTSSFTVVGSECISDNTTTTGTGLSADGRYLAYSCWDLDDNQDGAIDVLIWDRTTGTSTPITSDEDGLEARGGASISDDGRFVVYTYERPDSPSGAGTYLWDRTTDTSTLIAPVASDAAVSGDGSTVAFTAVAPDQTDDSITDLYVWDNPAA